MYTFLDHYDNEYGAIATIEVTNAVNGEKSIKGEIYSNDNVLHNIDKGWRLRFQDEYFVITYAKPKDVGNKVQVSFDAVHQFFWDFSKMPANEQLADGSHTFQAYLEFIFKDTSYRYNLEQNAKAFEKQSFGYKSKLALFNDVISTAGVEFQVNGKVVRILEKTGTDLSTVVRKNFNMNDLTIEKNIDGFITYQKGFGAWNDKDDHSKGRLEVEYESPLAKEFGRLGGEPVVDERYTDSQSLLSVLKSNVENSYTISVQIDMEDLTRAGYRYDQPVAGDYIMAINETLGFQEKIRIVSYTSQYDAKGILISHKVTCNDIGSVKKQSSSYTRLSKSVNESNQQIQDALIKANNALVTADGKNTSYFGTEFPEDVPKGTLTKGDIFYRTVGDRTLMYFWNGSDWEDNPVINDTEEFKRSIDQQFEEFNTSYDEAKELQDQQIADVLAKAGVAENLATDAKRISDEVKSGLSDKVSLQAFMDAYGGLSNAFAQQYNQLNGQLSTKLSRVEVDGYLGAKGYITNSALQNSLRSYPTITEMQNKVTETATSFERTISRVESQIPTESGGRNYIRGTAEMVIGSGRWQDGTFRKSGTGNIKTINISNPPVPNVTKGIEVEIASATECGIAQDTLFLPKGTYTFTVWVKGPAGATGRIDTFNGSGSKSKVFKLTGGWDKVTVTNTSTVDETKSVGYVYLQNSPGYPAKMHLTAPKLEAGTIPTDYTLAIEDLATVTALHNVTDTVDSHTRTIGAVGTAGSILDNVSKVTQTAAGLVQEVSGANGLKTQVSQLKDSWAVKLSGPDGLKTAINASTDGIRLLGKNIHLDGNTLIDNGVIKSAMIGNAQINTAHIGTIDAGQANIININASHITSGTITGIDMRGGVLSAINGNTVFDLNNAKLSFNSDAKIEFYNNNNALRRVVNGYGNQFIKFKTGGFTRDGKTGWNANTTVIGSNRGGSESDENGEFAGLRIWNMKLPSQNKSADQIDIIGDTVAIMDSATGGSRSPWVFYNHNGTNQLAFVGNAENSKQHFIGTTDRPFEQIHGKTIVASRDMFVQGERVAKMIKDLALKIGYKGNDGWADRIG